MLTQGEGNDRLFKPEQFHNLAAVDRYFSFKINAYGGPCMGKHFMSLGKNIKRMKRPLPNGSIETEGGSIE